MGKVQAQPDYPRGITFEQVWAALMENREQLRENAEQQKAFQKETDRIIKESVKRQEEAVKEAAKQFAKRQEEFAKRQEEAAKEAVKRQEESAKEAAKRQEEAVKETAKRQEESAKEAAKRQEESAKEAAKRQEESAKRYEELDRIVKENAKLIGNLGSRYGEMIEYMVRPNLIHKFNELGFGFTKVHQSTSIKDNVHDIFAQVDLTLENGDKVMIVEVKSKPSVSDIKAHVTRMEKVRLHADLHGDKRKYLGAVAGMVISDNVRGHILKNGFYMIEPSGETFTITSPTGKPKEW